MVFDFDGTLAEFHLDFGLMKQRVAAVAAQYLQSVPPPDRPVLEWLDYLEELIGAVDNKGSRLFRARSEETIVQMELEAARRGALFPFTRGLLTRLHELDILTAIITRNCSAAVLSVFPDLERYCSCFLARDHVGRVKPDPEHIYVALERLGTSPEHSLMVGDHPLDVQTGKRAGTMTAGVASGSASWSDLANSGADWVASDCQSLFDILEVGGFLGFC